MYQPLGTITLKSGEVVEAGVVAAPDTAWSERLKKLLGHKPPIWLWQIEELLTRDVSVEVYFHVLHRAGEPFSQIMTVEVSGVGILGHVWTEPADRGQGAAPLLLQKLLEYFRARGGHALYLGTGFGSAPYRIYERCGFRGLEDESGAMAIFNSSQAEFERAYFEPGGTAIEPLDWPHWPASAALFAADFPGVVRNVQFGLFGRALTEGPLLEALHAERMRGDEPPHAYVLKKLQNGAVVGLASWGRHPLWSRTSIVDVYCHPAYWQRAGALLERLSPPATDRAVAYCDAGFDAKCAVLRAAGFGPLTTLPQWIARDVARTHYLDVEILARG